MNLEEELRQLRIKEDLALRNKDYDEAIFLKEKRLLLELDEVRDLKGTVKKVQIFNPLNHSEIKAVSMEKVGLNYIPLIKGGFNLLTGRGGSGKSAIALKSMLMWLNDNPDKTALAYFTEDGIKEIKQRTKTICRNSNLAHTIIDRIFFISLDNDDRIKWATASNKEYHVREDYIQSIIDFCLKNKTEYIILDPLKRFHSLNENSNDDMDIVTRDCFVKLAIETKSVLLVLHHASKSGDGGGRGASTITDTSRITWEIGRFYTKDKLTGVIQEMEDKKGKVSLKAYKDNFGLERFCKIRAEHDKSISNPLICFDGPIVHEFQSESKTNDNNFINEIF